MTLTIQDLGALGELLGSIAVLVTLVYLAMQTRQNTMAISAQLDAARLDAATTLALAPSNSPDLHAELGQDRLLAEPAGGRRCGQYWQAMFQFIQWQYVQGRRGVLPTFYEPGVAQVVSAVFEGSQNVGAWWDGRKETYLPEFVEWVEEQRAKVA